MRSTGKPVEGHVEADSEEWAFHALANNGIITESMKADPAQAPAPPPQPLTTRAEPPLLGPYQSAPAALPLPSPSTLSNPATPRPANPPGTFAVGGSTTAPAASQAPASSGAAPSNGAPAEARTKFDNALDGALDGASSQVDFDALTDRYRGKKVWVIDRDKIRRNVARVADQAIAQSLMNNDGSAATRERVADAINELFKDTRNLTSQHTATNTSLEKQIGRLAGIIKQFEGSMAQMQAAIRNIGSGGGGGGGGPRRHRGAPEGTAKQEQNAVLLEIFKTNLDLLRGMEEEMRVASGAALDEVIAETEGAESIEGAPVEAAGEPEPAIAQGAPDSENNG